MTCLTPEQLDALAREELPPNDAEALRAHLVACVVCMRRLDECRENEALLSNVRRVRAGRTKDQAETISHEAHPAAPGAVGAVSTSAQATLQIASRSDTPAYAYPVIEGYEILSVLHRGGQGVVYKAVQKATKRTVAIKVLLAGVGAGQRSRLRFEREIDLASSLQHGNIVTVFDSGLASGLTYLVMEHIRGQQLGEFLRENPNLTILEKLRLFERICAGLAYAHKRGVIHRDLKPGNIMVDVFGEPKVLDFGLAKAVGRDVIGGGRPVTLTREFVGTLAYASPEQTRGNPDLIDTRTDVYSLGVILYEMITGQYPYDVAGNMADVLKHIAETPAERPSAACRRASTSAGSGASRRSRRGDRIDEDLETIVLQALAKERERRYQSIDALVADIENYVQGRPIDAKRDSALYVLRKLARRNRYGAACLLLVAASLLGFAAASFHFYHGEQTARIGVARERDQLAQRNALLEAAEANLRSRLPSELLGWFLMEWRAGRTEAAQAIAVDFPQGSPHRRAVEFLLHGVFDSSTIAKLRQELGPFHDQLAEYTACEALASAGRLDDAAASCERAAEPAGTLAGHGPGSISADPRLEAAARARLADLRSGIEEGRAQAGKSPRSAGDSPGGS